MLSFSWPRERVLKQLQRVIANISTKGLSCVDCVRIIDCVSSRNVGQSGDINCH
jgi:hypothetical protein